MTPPSRGPAEASVRPTVNRLRSLGPGWAWAAVIAVRMAAGLLTLPTPLFSKYPDGARLLLAGSLTPERAADFSPLYLLLNALIAPGGLRVLQAAVLGAMLWAMGRIASRLWGALAGFVAVLLGALALPLLLYEATLEPDLLSVAGTVVALAAVLAVAERRRLRDALLMGLALATAVAARPTGLLVTALILAYLGYQLRDHPRRAAGILGLALAVTLAFGALPSSILRLVSHQPLAATMSAGEVLQMGNRPESPGLGQQPSAFAKALERQHASSSNPDEAHAIYRALARAEAGRALTPMGSERFWASKALAFAREEPWAFARMWGRKLGYLLLGPDGHDLSQVRRAEVEWSGRPWLPTPLLAALGIAGLLAGLWARRRLGPVWLLLAQGIAVGVVFSVLARYRLPVVCAFALAGGLLAALVRDGLRSRRTLAIAAVATAVSLLMPWSLPFLLDGRRVLAHANDASAQEASFRAQRAARNWRGMTQQFTSLEASQPFVVLTHDLRGIPFEDDALNRAAGRIAAERYGASSRADAFFMQALALRSGDCERAEPLAQAADGFHWAIFDALLEPHLLQARCWMARGEHRRALEEVGASLERVPGSVDALAAAVALTEAAPGSVGGDGPRWRSELFALHDVTSARYALASEEVRLGLGQQALGNLQPVLAAFPDSGAARYLEARALLLLDRREEGLLAYARALELFPTHAFATTPFDAAIRGALEAAPNDARWLSLAAEQALRQGRVREAHRLDLHTASLWGRFTPPEVRTRLAMYTGSP